MTEQKKEPPKNPVLTWQSREEYETVQKAIQDFSFGPQEASLEKLLELPPITILLIGQEGSGKTHFSLTMCEAGPVYFIDTEYKGQYVINKFKKQGRNNILYAQAKNYIELYGTIKGIIKKYPPGTVVIDSGSDYQKYAEQRVLAEVGIEKIFPIPVWGLVWQKCDVPIESLNKGGFNVVLTCRMKDEYIGDRSTGKLVPRIYDKLLYSSLVRVRCYQDKKKSLKLTEFGKPGLSVSEEYNFELTTTLPQLIKDLEERC